MLSPHVTHRLAVAGTSLVLVASVATGITMINNNKPEPQVKGVATKAAATKATPQDKTTSVVKPASGPANTSAPAAKTAQSNKPAATKKPAQSPATASTPAKSTVTTEVVASAPAKGTPSTPSSPVVIPPTPQCPECGADPDKVVTHNGALVLSAATVTIAAGDSNSSLLTARSDSGEAITIAYPTFTAGSPMLATVAAPGQTTYAISQTFGLSVSQGVAPGAYQVTLRASSQTQGAYTATITVVVTPAQ